MASPRLRYNYDDSLENHREQINPIAGEVRKVDGRQRRSAANDQHYEQHPPANIRGAVATLNPSNIRSIKTETKTRATDYALTEDHLDRLAITPTHRAFQIAAAKRGIQPYSKLESTPQTKNPTSNQTQVPAINRAEPPPPAAEPASAASPPIDTKSLQKQLGKKAALKKKGEDVVGAVAAKMLARPLTMWIWGWGTFTYLFIQLPFAILSLLFFVIAATVDSAKNMMNYNPDDSYLTSMAKWLGHAVGDAASWTAGGLSWIIQKLSGWDPSVLLEVVDPENWFLICMALVFFFAIIQLLFIHLTYSLAMLRPLSGKAATFKQIALLVAIIGYSFPILNLFPWFVGWTLVVMLRPK